MKISLEKAIAEFRPDESIRGRVEWSPEETPIQSLDVRLIWYTGGKGTRDVQVVAQQTISAAPANGQQPFQFKAPRGPFSFSGKLISLVWAIEVIAMPGRDAERVDLEIAPTGKEILLSTLDKVTMESQAEVE